MEAAQYPEQSSVSWVARLVELLQPLSVRADRLAGIELFGGLRWADLEFAADLLRETEVERGTRMTVQGQPSRWFWLIIEGEALVSANARPLRMAGYGDPVGLTSMLLGRGSPETAIALGPIRALAAGPEEFRELIARPSVRARFAAVIRDAGRPGRSRPRPQSSEAASASPP
jgi:CRP-like cAMP-binding protein